MPNVNDIQTQVRETVKRGQEAVLTTVKEWGDTVNNLVPEVAVPFADQIPNYVPQAKSAVNTAFDVAEQAVARQRKAVIGILDTLESRIESAKGSGKETAKASTKAEAKSG